jgi:hypothetical protein
MPYTYLLTELSPSWEAANCAATQELPSILCNPKFHHRVHKSPPLVPILSQIDPYKLRKIRSLCFRKTKQYVHSYQYPLRDGSSSSRLKLHSSFGWNCLYSCWQVKVRVPLEHFGNETQQAETNGEGKTKYPVFKFSCRWGMFAFSLRFDIDIACIVLSCVRGSYLGLNTGNCDGHFS